MTRSEIAAARALAQSDADLSMHDDAILFGCALPDFRPVYVALGVVARMMRWQCCQFDGGWDERQYNEDIHAYRRNVRIA